MHHAAKKTATPVLGAMLLGGLTLASSAFSMTPLAGGYLLSAQEAADTPVQSAEEPAQKPDCGEGKCGEGMCGEGKCGQGGCGQGRCRDKPAQSEAAAAEAKQAAQEQDDAAVPVRGDD